MKLMILGRDGVINERRDTPIGNPEDCVPIPGSLDAIARLCQAGYRVVVAADNTGLDAGHLDVDDLNRVHDKLQICAAGSGGHLDAIFFNSDLEAGNADGDASIYEAIASRLQISLKSTPAVTDCLELARAAQEAGARSVLLAADTNSSLAGKRRWKASRFIRTSQPS